MIRKLRSTRLSPALVVSLIALFVSLGGVGYSATGGSFILGGSNKANKGSSLTANVAGKTLTLKNTSTGAGASALNLNVAGTKPPFTTNSGTKVANLNADKLDGLSSAAFLGTGAKASDADLLDGMTATDFLWLNSKALDSENLDGQDSTDFLGAGDTAVNSGLLDGMDSKAFARLGGVINGNGTIVQGTGFTISKLGTGDYQITFPDGTLSSANCPPIVAVIAVTAGTDRNAIITNRSCSSSGGGSFDTKLLDAAGDAQDTPFIFLAM